MNIFTQQARYTVPLFQRPYVWKLEDQWAPLWDDLRATADRVLNAQDKAVASHFLGTVVLDQTSNPTGSLPRREVIDGQQRLTTLQLLLKAAEHALDGQRAAVSGDEAATKAIDIAARQIAPLTSNPAYAEEDEKYKVWPTNEDRSAFRDVMDSKAVTGPDQPGSRMAEAYFYFRSEFSAWLQVDSFGDRARALASALKDHLKLIVLDLEETDEPQAIFETLNAHGTPLLPADLIKNWLLWEGTRQDLETNKLYNSYWRRFDREGDYWRATIGTGHAARARLDTFLQNWLTRHMREPISPKHLYDRFLNFVKAGGKRNEDGSINVEALMIDIAADSDRFKTIENSKGKSRFDVFLRRLNVLDVVVFHPVILEMMGRSGSDSADRDLFAIAMESYLLRRMVCGLQTRGYGTLALQLLTKVADRPKDQPVAPLVIAFLAGSTEGAVVWPGNDDFKAEWVERKFYGVLRRSRVLMILTALEEQYQREDQKAEPILSFNYGALEIEHILPRAWESHWDLSSNVTREERNRVIHGIGNLTLISGKLNKELSHGPWLAPNGQSSKQAGLRKHSKLELNARLLREHVDLWDESAIATRAKLLFETASNLWPSPASLIPKVNPPSNEQNSQGSVDDVGRSHEDGGSLFNASNNDLTSTGCAEPISSGYQRNSIESLKNLKETGSATHGEHRVVKYENGTILVEKNGRTQRMAMPILCEIANEIGVDVRNSAGNMKNTRSIGASIIKAISLS